MSTFLLMKIKERARRHTLTIEPTLDDVIKIVKK